MNRTNNSAGNGDSVTPSERATSNKAKPTAKPTTVRTIHDPRINSGLLGLLFRAMCAHGYFIFTGAFTRGECLKISTSGFFGSLSMEKFCLCAAR
jgi:hypothetical protein